MAPPIPTTALTAPITTQRYQGASGCLVNAPTNLGMSMGIFVGYRGHYMGVEPKNRGVYPPRWMVKIMEHLIKMDDLGVPLFLETPILQTQTMHYDKVNSCKFFKLTTSWHCLIPTKWETLMIPPGVC